MSQERPQTEARAGAADRAVESVNAVLDGSSGQDEARRRLVVALEMAHREIDVASDTFALCEDLEGTAYHLRRALAQLKFAGGVLVDLRKRRSASDG